MRRSMGHGLRANVCHRNVLGFGEAFKRVVVHNRAFIATIRPEQARARIPRLSTRSSS
jgi:hypothetical protein